MRRFQFDAHRIEADFWILGRWSEEIDPQVTCLEPGQCEGFEVPGCIEYSGVSPPPHAAAEKSRTSPVRCSPGACRYELRGLELAGEHDPKHQETFAIHEVDVDLRRHLDTPE